MHNQEHNQDFVIMMKQNSGNIQDLVSWFDFVAQHKMHFVRVFFRFHLIKNKNKKINKFV